MGFGIRFCGAKDGDVVCFGSSLSFTLESSPSLRLLWAQDRSNWPRCLLWHGWLLGLSLGGERDPWASSLGHLADWGGRTMLGCLPSGDCAF